MKKLLIIIITAITMATPAIAERLDGDDLLLLFLPAMSGAEMMPEPEPDPVPVGISKLKQLHGQWYFRRDRFDEYFRFDGNTARKSSDPTLFFIDGEGSIFTNFLSEWCDGYGGMITAYSTEVNGYILICDWGTPRFDLGSIYYFDRVGSQFPFSHFYYNPSTGELSTGIEHPGTARRLSSSYNSVRSGANTKTTDSMDDTKSAMYSQYLQQKQASARKPASMSGLEIRLQDQLRRVLETR